jgi:hypothetical protein
MHLASNRLDSNYTDMYIAYFIIFIKILIKINQAMLERTLPALNVHHGLHLLYKVATSLKSSGLQEDGTTTIRKAITHLYVREGRMTTIRHLVTT